MTDEPVLLPIQDEPLPEDDAFTRWEESIDAQPEAVDLTVVEEELTPVGRGWGFDFQTRQFVASAVGHSPLETFGIASLRTWIESAIRTGRGAYPIYCADEETQILTEAGWVDHGDLRPGARVLTLNHDRNLAEWQPVRAVNRFDVRDEAMVLIESRLHSSLTTGEHRWPTLHRFRRGTERHWTTSAKLNSEDRIITAAPCAALPVEETFPDHLVEAVAWFYTEGHVATRGRSPQVSLCQSDGANPQNVKRIQGALNGLFGPATEKRMGTGTGTLAPPKWREYRPPNRDIVTFWLNTAASSELLAVAPEKIVSLDFIRALTREQLQLFVATSFAADGCRTSNGTLVFGQKDPRRLCALELALILLGRAPHTYSGDIQRSRDGKPYRMAMLSVGPRRTTGLTTTRPIQRRYTGTVWCPTTKNGTWLARRNGCVYFTGNSDDFGLDFPSSFFGGPVSSFPSDQFEEAVREALAQHPQIANIEDFSSAYDPDQEWVVVNFTVVLASGESFDIESLTVGG